MQEIKNQFHGGSHDMRNNVFCKDMCFLVAG